MEEKVEQGGEEGVLRLAAGAARITVGCTGSEVGKHTSKWEGSFVVATSGDLGAVVDKGRRSSGGVYSWE